MSCLGLIYVILVVNSKEKFVIMVLTCFCARGVRELWYVAWRARLQSGSRARCAR